VNAQLPAQREPCRVRDILPEQAERMRGEHAHDLFEVGILSEVTGEGSAELTNLPSFSSSSVLPMKVHRRNPSLKSARVSIFWQYRLIIQSLFSLYRLNEGRPLGRST